MTQVFTEPILAMVVGVGGFMLAWRVFRREVKRERLLEDLGEASVKYEEAR